MVKTEEKNMRQMMQCHKLMLSSKMCSVGRLSNHLQVSSVKQGSRLDVSSRSMEIGNEKTLYVDGINKLVK